MISVVFQGLAGVLASALYARNHFALPAFATAVYNVGIIAGVLLLAETLGVQALAVGLVLGALAQFLLQAFGLRAFWAAYRTVFVRAKGEPRGMFRQRGWIPRSW